MADIIGTESDDTLTGTTDMDTITGLGGNDTINADDGADIIYGGDGDDIINAGAGGDFIVGGGGADAIDGGDGIDTVNYFGALTGVTVNLSDAAQNTGDAAGDTFVNVENVEGSTFDDLIIGDNAANDLRGGEGNDGYLWRHPNPYRRNWPWFYQPGHDNQSDAVPIPVQCHAHRRQLYG